MRTNLPETRDIQVPVEGFFKNASIPWGYRPRNEVFTNDPRKEKLDLAAGVLRDDSGGMISYRSVEEARKNILARGVATSYLAPAGLPEFRSAIHSLLFADSNQHGFTMQTFGAAGAMSLAAKALQRLGLADAVLISNESWGEHARIFEMAGY
ncbi:MAG: aminotransferase class I/II-fold pyridoxal phosphate-dependent enzyme, partial [Bdellovibrionales bacterium]|nr:aminotransferase class I/II-fold pyridoxal phosphate-dependent enzyme [Bdellovibrionales bacterium]